MNKNLSELAPKEVWGYFNSLTQIPRPSKKEEKIIQFMLDFGKKLGLETINDKIGNVIIRKPATKGKEHCKGVILQTHLDMVPQKNSDKVHDFEKDPIEAYIDGEWVTAKGTTLGADNGIGVAATMAVLASKEISHGPIEALFTIDEETGMTGAFGLESGVLKGDILINLDSEDEGELYVGCAGGLDGYFDLPYKEETIPANYECFEVVVKGLKGGHSGMDIVLGRGNSNKIMFRFLKQASKEVGLRISSVQGGNMRNAIPREAFAKVAIPSTNVSQFSSILKNFENTVQNELKGTEPDLAIVCEKANCKTVLDSVAQEKLINVVYACPNGVFRMSDAVPGLVETSNNMAIVKTENGIATISCLMRSSVESAKEDLANMMEAVFTLAGAKCEFKGAYPGWKPNPDSVILKKMVQVYEKMYGVKPEIKAIHAGLECGLLGGVYPNWDMISCGPTIRSPHSPDERVKIDTVEKWWKFLVETLENID